MLHILDKLAALMIDSQIILLISGFVILLVSSFFSWNSWIVILNTNMDFSVFQKKGQIQSPPDEMKAIIWSASQGKDFCPMWECKAMMQVVWIEDHCFHQLRVYILGIWQRVWFLSPDGKKFCTPWNDVKWLYHPHFLYWLVCPWYCFLQEK